MNIKTVIKVTLLTTEVALLVAEGVKALRRKLQAQNESELERNFRAFKAECTKSNEAAIKALKLMDELSEEISDQMGIDPTTIDVQIDEVTFSEAGG